MPENVLHRLWRKLFPTTETAKAPVKAHAEAPVLNPSQYDPAVDYEPPGVLSWVSAEESYPYKIARVPGQQALHYLSQGEPEGVRVLLGDQRHFAEVAETIGFNNKHSTDRLLELAIEIDPLAWFQKRKESEPEYFAIEAGPWPPAEQVGPHRITAHCDIRTGKPYAEAFLTLIPTREAWMAPCYLRMGNWNEMPSAEVQSALHKYWFERYGSRIVAYTNDVIECTVERPPTTTETALELAHEQFLYCPDIVYQGVQTIERLAATLQNSPAWYFWWD